MSEIKLKLTPFAPCCNSQCGNFLYVELMRFPDDEACLECVPSREDLPTAFRLLPRADLRSLPPFKDAK